MAEDSEVRTRVMSNASCPSKSVVGMLIALLTLVIPRFAWATRAAIASTRSLSSFIFSLAALWTCDASTPVREIHWQLRPTDLNPHRNTDLLLFERFSNRSGELHRSFARQSSQSARGAASAPERVQSVPAFASPGLAPCNVLRACWAACWARLDCSFLRFFGALVGLKGRLNALVARRVTRAPSDHNLCTPRLCSRCPGCPAREFGVPHMFISRGRIGTRTDDYLIHPTLMRSLPAASR